MSIEARLHEIEMAVRNTRDANNPRYLQTKALDDIENKVSELRAELQPLITDLLAFYRVGDILAERMARSAAASGVVEAAARTAASLVLDDARREAETGRLVQQYLAASTPVRQEMLPTLATIFVPGWAFGAFGGIEKPELLRYTLQARIWHYTGEEAWKLVDGIIGFLADDMSRRKAQEAEREAIQAQQVEATNAQHVVPAPAGTKVLRFVLDERDRDMQDLIQQHGHGFAARSTGGIGNLLLIIVPEGDQYMYLPDNAVLVPSWFDREVTLRMQAENMRRTRAEVEAEVRAGPWSLALIDPDEDHISIVEELDWIGVEGDVKKTVRQWLAERST